VLLAAIVLDDQHGAKPDMTSSGRERKVCFRVRECSFGVATLANLGVHLAKQQKNLARAKAAPENGGDSQMPFPKAEEK
jgi:hypothetical protein